jgi:nucleotide-binding universal stress UspA family protein
MESPDQKGRGLLKNILLATDFSTASEVALPQALKIAGQYGSTLYIAHVICPELVHFLPADSTVTIIEDARRLAHQNMEHLLSVASQAGVPCHSLIGEGVIWDVLEDMIQENHIDLIVLGTHGRRACGKCCSAR